MSINHIDFTDYPHPMSPPGPVSPSEFLLNNTMSLLGFILIFLVLLKMITMVMSYRKYTRQEKERALAEASRRRAETTPPAFASAAHADAVYMYAHRSLYQFLLVELRCVLETEGFTMVTGRWRSAPLCDESKERVSRHLFMAQQQYCAMYGIYRGDIATDKYYDSDKAWRLCLGLVKGSEAIGWYVAPIAHGNTASQASASSSAH